MAHPDRPSTFSRRDFLRLSALLGLAAVSAACAPQASQTPISREDALKALGITEDQIAALQSHSLTSGVGATATETAEPRETKVSVQELKTVTLHNSDGQEVTVSLPKNFIPDKDLKVSDISALNVLPISEEAANFQKFLNTPNNPTDQPLAGYMYGTNDYNQYKDRQSGPQLPIYAWLIHTGEIVDILGIGRVEGSPGKAVMVLIINRTDKVYQWPPNTVYVKSGFQGAGRIWNGEAPFIQEAERRLTQHYAYILGNGHPESGFIGQCDLPENCYSVTAVSVERIQWGNNPNGSPRYQFRLIRAEDIPLK